MITNTAARGRLVRIECLPAMSDPKYSSKPASDHIAAGASAARLLSEACESSPRDGPSLQLEVVRDLARDLERQLAGLADSKEDIPPDLAADAAQRCADLATLAACNATGLESPRQAGEAVRLAAEATNSLASSLEHAPGIPNDGERWELIGRDLRSASWKASLAARQMEDLSSGG